MKPQSPFSRLLALALLLVGLSKTAPAFVQLNPPSVWPDGDIVMHLQLGPLNRALGDGSPSWNAAAKSALEAWNPHMERAKFTTVMDSTAPIGSGNGVSKSGTKMTRTIQSFFSAPARTMRKMTRDTTNAEHIILHSSGAPIVHTACTASTTASTAFTRCPRSVNRGNS
jgi:hypothetical protein